MTITSFFVRCLIPSAVASLFFSLTGASAPEAGYHLLHKYALDQGASAHESWSFLQVDEAARLVYVSHDTEFIVANVDTGVVVGRMPGMKQVHDVAILKELGRGFLTDGGSNQVDVFDLKTFKVTGQIPAGEDADGILYDPASKHLFVMNGRTNDITVIDPASQMVIATIPMGGRPEYAVADGKGLVFDNIHGGGDKSEVVVIDSRTNTIKNHWPTAPASPAHPLAMDIQHRRLFIGGRNKTFEIMDADTGKIIQTFPIEEDVESNAYDPGTGLAFCATRAGTIHIFHEDSADKFSVVETVKTEAGAGTMALDPKTHRIFVDAADIGPAPAPTATQTHPSPTPIPGTFHLLEYGP
jgi:YVTN family beta-propeller protein